MAEEIERYRAKVNFRHKFENIKQNRDSIAIFDISAPPFFARNIPFHIALSKNDKAISIEIDISCPSNFKGVSVNAKFQYSLITPSKTMQSEEFSYTFKPGMPGRFDIPHTTILSEIFPYEEIVVDDAVTIEVSLWAREPQGMANFKPPKEKLRQELQIEGHQETSDAFSSLFDSGDFSDMSFVTKLDSSRVKAHKAILSARSPVFARMLTSDMKEAKDNEIVIDDMGAPALQIMLRHIYTGQLGFPKGPEIDLKICQELANAGEKYDLQKLKKYAAMAMTEFVSLENAWELLLLAERLQAKAATKALASFYAENVDKIMKSV